MKKAGELGLLGITSDTKYGGNNYFKAISGRSDFIEHFITLENFLSNM